MPLNLPKYLASLLNYCYLLLTVGMGAMFILARKLCSSPQLSLCHVLHITWSTPSLWVDFLLLYFKNVSSYAQLFIFVFFPVSTNLVLATPILRAIHLNFQTI